MYVRFVVHEISEDTGVELGIFQAMFGLCRAGKLASHEEAWWAEVRRWFNVRLDEPDRFARSRRPGANAAGVCWFKATARRHISRAREIAALLAQHDIASRMLTCQRPGYIVYEDEFQVTAEPFRSELQ